MDDSGTNIYVCRNDGNIQLWDIRFMPSQSITSYNISTLIMLNEAKRDPNGHVALSMSTTFDILAHNRYFNANLPEAPRGIRDYYFTPTLHSFVV
jgi:hypothetical protein